MYWNGKFLVKHLFGLFGPEINKKILEGPVISASESNNQNKGLKSEVGFFIVVHIFENCLFLR